MVSGRPARHRGRHLQRRVVTGRCGCSAHGGVSDSALRLAVGIRLYGRAGPDLAGALLPSAILAPLAPSARLAIAATSLIIFGHGIWIANLLTLPTDLFHGPEVGTATGFSGMAGAVGGIIATLGTGYIVTKFSSTPIFIMAGLMHPFALFLIYRLLPRQYFEATM